VPSGQTESQDRDPATEKVPSLHTGQALLPSLCVPAGQEETVKRQSVDPETEYLFAGQGRQLPLPTLAKFPAGHVDTV